MVEAQPERFFAYRVRGASVFLKRLVWGVSSVQIEAWETENRPLDNPTDGLVQVHIAKPRNQ